MMNKAASTLGQGLSQFKHNNAATTTRKTRRSNGKTSQQTTPLNNSIAATYVSIDKSKIDHTMATDVGDTTLAELKMLQSKLAKDYKNPNLISREFNRERPTSGISH